MYVNWNCKEVEAAVTTAVVLVPGLPFSDLDSLKAATLDMIKDEFLFVGNFARAATKQLVFGLIGIVVAVSLFLNPRIQKFPSKPKDPNLFTAVTDEIKIRFRLFYESSKR